MSEKCKRCCNDHDLGTGEAENKLTALICLNRASRPDEWTLDEIMLEAKKITNKFDSEKSLADELAAALALCMGWIIFGEQGFPEQWDDAEKALAKHREMRGK